MPTPYDPDLIWIQRAIIEYDKSRNWIEAHCKTFITIERRIYVRRSEIEEELKPRAREKNMEDS